MSETEVDQIVDRVSSHGGLQATVDLEKQQVVLHGDAPARYRFDIEAGAKEQLINGLDDIDRTLKFEAEISRFEKNYDPYR